MNLSNEIISYIATFCDPYTSLALGRKPNHVRLFIEGGPGILLNRILERGGDIKLLYQMKMLYFPKVEVPMIKCVQLENEDVMKKVIRIWDTRHCGEANRLAHEKEFIFGMRYIGPEISNIRDMNLYYIRKGKLDLVDISIENPFSLIHCNLENLGMLDNLWQDEKLRKYLDDNQKAMYLGSKGIISDVSPSMNVLWLASYGYTDLAKSIYVKERDTSEHNYCIPAKLGIWDDTPYPEFCKAVYMKDYIKVNAILEDNNEGWTITDCYNEDWAYSYEQGYAVVQMEEDGTWDIEEDCYTWGWGCSSVSTTFDIQDILSGKVPSASLITSEEKETMAIIQHMVENKEKWYVERRYAYSTTINVIEDGKMRLSINGNDTSDLDVAIKHFLPMTRKSTLEIQKEGLTSSLHLLDYL